MMGSFLTRGLVMVLGYTYPAYECFKIVEKNKPEIEQLRFWCQYWILVAVLTVLERVGDTFISWVPMYSEAKLAFFVYLWYPKTRGTAYVYDTFLKPYVAKHETEIDRNLMELRAKAGDIVVLYWQKAASYGHTRIFEIMQYAAASQTPRPHAAQHAGVRRPPPAAPAQPPPPKQPQPAQQPPPPKQPQPAQQPPPPKQPQPAQQPPSPKQPHPAQPPPRPKQPQRPPATAAVGQQDKPGQETRATIAPQTAAAPAPAQTQAQATVPAPVTTEAPSQSTVSSEGQLTEAKPVLVPLNEGADPPPQEKVMEEAIRMTRGRLRKTRAASSR